MEKYYDKISLSSRFVNFVFKIFPDKKNSESVEAAKKHIKKQQEKIIYNLPRKMGFSFLEYNGMNIYTYNGDLNDCQNIILYLHGGSFIEEAGRYQLRFAKRVAKSTNSVLVFPVYPLAPNATYEKTFSLLDDLYDKLLKYKKNIDFLGDSAGGGMVLSYAMYLRDRKIKGPKNIVMLSPLLDVSLSNPDIIKNDKTDYWCGIDGSKYEGMLWAGKTDLKNYLVSPLYGEFDNLGMITIITGTLEILNADCHLLSEKLKRKKIKHNFIEYRGQGHDFGAYPTIEGRLVVEDISSILRK